ncbi:MAG TPA: HDIG domain-containing protein [Desulfobacteraceae bacterium]|nr:HDIG domain-containing protein [Desulfobacteraceae bacterium]
MGKPDSAKASAFVQQPLLRWAILLMLAAIFAVLVFPRSAPVYDDYRVGDVAQKDIKAPRDFFIEDTRATEEKRREVEQTVQMVYDLDSQRLAILSEQVRQAFARMHDALIAERQRRELEEARQLSGTGGGVPPREPVALRETFARELGVVVDPEAFNLLTAAGFDESIADCIVAIASDILENGVVTSKEMLLREAGRGIVLRDIATQKERVVYDLEKLYAFDEAKAMVPELGEPLLKDIDPSLKAVIVDLTQLLIQPNITLNRSESAERRRLAMESVKPVLYQIKAGEMILREGERVTPVHLVKLKASRPESDRRQGIRQSLGAGLLLFCLLAVLNIVGLRRSTDFERAPLRNLVFMAAVLLLFFVLARLTLVLANGLGQVQPLGLTSAAVFFGMPLASGAMLVCLFFGLDLALATAVVLSVTLPLIAPERFPLVFYFLLNGALGAYWMQHCRERRAFITAGVRLALLNLVLVSAIALHTWSGNGVELLWCWGLAMMGGLGAGIVAAGLAPLVELAFGYTTDITLLELANLDRPILRQLMMEAPGTYHHSMIVGTLVEAAATEIGANPLLAKVCGYYHDIGKIKKPLYFIENQREGKNPHDKLAPSMSKRILVAHVKDGAEMARKHKLGRAIVDTICQSHGTSLISYFYERARQIHGEANVNPDDYRYPGPRPQTREAGLVMLADVVEAASRTLENPTPSRIKGLVHNLINKIFSDGQLDECELTLRDLNQIAKSFTKILTGIHHHRIEYPERSETDGRGKNGRSDRQSPEPSADRERKAGSAGQGHLRRLGMSRG